MPFAENDTVRIAHLRQVGKIIEVRPRGRYRVALGDLVIECKEHEIEPAAPRPAPEDTDRSVRNLTRAAENGRSELLQIDLHGMRVLDALKLVSEKIDRAVLADINEMRIIHGIGSGAIKNALHKLLSSLSVVREFRVEEGNPAITRVFF